MTDRENLKDTLEWMQRKLAAADRSLTNAQFNGDYPAAENIRKNMRRWRTAIKVVKAEIKPVRIDRNKWKPCCVCGCCSSCRYSLCSLTDSTSPCKSCYAKNNYLPRNFCPSCGRPLTDIGWKLLGEHLKKMEENKQCTQE